MSSDLHGCTWGRRWVRERPRGVIRMRGDTMLFFFIGNLGSEMSGQ